MAAYFEYRPGAGAARCSPTKARIKETGVMDPEFPNQSVIGDHFRGMVRGHRHGFPRG